MESQQVQPSLPADAPSPRLCHLIKWPDFDGYGFNLHAEKEKSGQYIGKVDDDSPAMLAGLREGDRIVEVNFVNISNENHRQVVERIKSIPNETRLLVVDKETDSWYKGHKVIIKSSLLNVIYYRTPIPRPHEKGLLPVPSSPDMALRNRMNLPRVNSNSGSVNGSSNLDNNHVHVTNNGIHNHSIHTTTTAIINHEAVSSGQDDKQTSQNNHSIERKNESIQKEEQKLSQIETLEETSREKINENNHEPVRECNVKNVTNNVTIISDRNGSTTPDVHSTMVKCENDENSLSSIKSQTIETQSPKSTHSSLSEARSIASNGSHHSLNGSYNGSTSASSSRPPSRPISTGDPQFDINLTKTASEMRQLIAARKKKDAKKANLDLREKYDLIQQL